MTVIIILFILSLDSLFINLKIEKCSESTGINLVLFLTNSFLIKFQPHIIDSLLATAIFLYVL